MLARPGSCAVRANASIVVVVGALVVIRAPAAAAGGASIAAPQVA
jgi:hypothetical protein